MIEFSSWKVVLGNIQQEVQAGVNILSDFLCISCNFKIYSFPFIFLFLCIISLNCWILTRRRGQRQKLNSSTCPMPTSQNNQRLALKNQRCAVTGSSTGAEEDRDSRNAADFN